MPGVVYTATSGTDHFVGTSGDDTIVGNAGTLSLAQADSFDGAGGRDAIVINEYGRSDYIPLYPPSSEQSDPEDAFNFSNFEDIYFVQVGGDTVTEVRTGIPFHGTLHGDPTTENVFGVFSPDAVLVAGPLNDTVYFHGGSFDGLGGVNTAKIGDADMVLDASTPLHNVSVIVSSTGHWQDQSGGSRKVTVFDSFFQNANVSNLVLQGQVMIDASGVTDPGHSLSITTAASASKLFIVAGAGNDDITVLKPYNLPASSTIDGGGGSDIVHLWAPQSDILITHNSDGSYSAQSLADTSGGVPPVPAGGGVVVSPPPPGSNPTFLKNVEKIYFSDGTLYDPSHAPVPNNGSVTTDETVQGTVSATDPDGDPLTYGYAGFPAHGDFSLQPNGAFAYTSKPGFIGDDRFYFSVSDGHNASIGYVDVHVVAPTNQVLTGGSGGDTLLGSAGADTLSGLGGADSLVGDRGRDVLDGGKGADTMVGGMGDDIYYVDDRGDKIVETIDNSNGGGHDEVRTGLSGYTLRGNVDNLTLLYSDDISGFGSYTNNRLTGNAGANVLKGGGGADTLLGGDGADTLVGQSGADVCIGGAGADVFQYENVYDIGSSSERITDFSHAQGDRIDLHLIDADTLVAGDQAFVFIGSEFFHRTAGELRTYAYAGDYLVQGDVDGDGTADFTLRVNAPLVSGDFIF